MSEAYAAARCDSSSRSRTFFGYGRDRQSGALGRLIVRRPQSSGRGGIMRVNKFTIVAFVAFSLAAVPAGAQNAKTVEVTPYVALGSAGVFPLGVAVTFPVTSTLSVETDVTYRRGEGRIQRAGYEHQSLVVSAARPPIDTVCRCGSRTVGIRGTHFFLRRSSRRHPVARGHDGERWRWPEDANE